MPRALIIWGGADCHEPDKCAEIFRQVLEKENYEVIVRNDLEVYEDRKTMGSLSLIVPIWTGGSITELQLRGLMDTVADGCGIAGWHGGMCDSFHDATPYHYLTGGQWVAHPGNLVNYTVNIVKHEDPIVEGLDDFQMYSEQYYMHVDPSNDVLATTTFEGFGGDYWIKGTVMPAVWKRMFAEGKVFYASIGHHAVDFDVPEAKEIVRRGMLWATKTD